MEKLKPIKRLIFGFIALSFLLLGQTTLAALTFDPLEPQPINTEITPTCSVGDNYFVWFPADYASPNGYISVNPCATSFTTNSDVAGDYTITECDSTAGTCDSSIGSLDDARLDPGYVSEENYLFTDEGTKTPYNIKTEITTFEYNVDGTVGTSTATTTYNYFDGIILAIIILIVIKTIGFWFKLKY